MEDRRPALEVSNYSESDAGVLDLTAATRESSNTAYAQLMLSLGTDIIDPDGDGSRRSPEGPTRGQARQADGVGGSGGIAQDDIEPAMVLGTVNATPLEMAGAYSTFANRGVYQRPQIVTGSSRSTRRATSRSSRSASPRRPRC